MKKSGGEYDDTFIVLVECMREMFPEMEEMEVAPEIKLEEIPEWDSMSLVNLQTGIEAAFGVNIPAMALKESLTIGELVGYVRNRYYPRGGRRGLRNAGGGKR